MPKNRAVHRSRMAAVGREISPAPPSLPGSHCYSDTREYCLSSSRSQSPSDNSLFGPCKQLFSPQGSNLNQCKNRCWQKAYPHQAIGCLQTWLILQPRTQVKPKCESPLPLLKVKEHLRVEHLRVFPRHNSTRYVGLMDYTCVAFIFHGINFPFMEVQGIR